MTPKKGNIQMAGNNGKPCLAGPVNGYAVTLTLSDGTELDAYVHRCNPFVRYKGRLHRTSTKSRVWHCSDPESGLCYAMSANHGKMGWFATRDQARWGAQSRVEHMVPDIIRDTIRRAREHALTLKREEVR